MYMCVCVCILFEYGWVNAIMTLHTLVRRAKEFDAILYMSYNYFQKTRRTNARQIIRVVV